MLLLSVLLACTPPPSDTSGGRDTSPGDTDPTNTTPTDTATSTGACGEGEVWDDGGCVPEACGRGTWGDLPRGDDAAWVDAAAAEGGDGSRDFPFRTIAEGLETRKVFVYVAAGEYAEAVVVGGGVTLGGRCAELVTVDADGEAVGIEVVGESDVHGFTVRRAEEVGIAVRDGGSLTLAGTVVRESVGIGILADGRDASVAAFEVEVSDTDADPERGGGIGISVQSGAVATLTSVLLEDNQQRGLYVRGYPSAAVLTNVTIRGTRPYDDGSYGHGLAAETGAVVTGSGVTVEGNTEAGLWVSGEDSTLTLTESVVSGTLPSVRWAVGMGAVAADGGALDFTGTLTTNAGPGLVVQGGSAEVRAGSSVLDSEFASVVVVDGSATLRGSILDGVRLQAELGGGYLAYVDGDEASPTFTLDEMVMGGSLNGVFANSPGTYLIQNSTLSGPDSGNGLVVSGHVTPWDGTNGMRLVADTVEHWGVGVLADGASATVNEMVWRGNGTDLVQVNCDEVPAMEGDGLWGRTDVCTGTEWPYIRPHWTRLE